MGLFGTNKAQEIELERLVSAGIANTERGQQEFNLTLSLLAGGITNLSMSQMLELGQERLQDLGLTITAVNIDEWSHKAHIQVKLSPDYSDPRIERPKIGEFFSSDELAILNQASQARDDFVKDSIGKSDSEILRTAHDEILRRGLAEWGNTGVISGLPVGQRLPEQGEYHVLWQHYQYGPTVEHAMDRTIEWLTQKTPWDFSYFVIDSRGQRMNVVGAWIDPEWAFFRRALDPGEFHVLWEAYIKAPDAVEAKQEACRRIEFGLANETLELIAVS